jgi:hypothetical protein|tara:strand:- start:26 stop:301 length:276 start_codon:yes stop_codon:yes gene_type:complete
MKTLLSIIISLLTGYIIGRYTRFRSKNYGVTRKMFLTLEKGEIDRKIDMALNLEDYESALLLKRKMERLERKINRVKRKEERKKNGQSKKN